MENPAEFDLYFVFDYYLLHFISDLRVIEVEIGFILDGLEICKVSFLVF